MPKTQRHFGKRHRNIQFTQSRYPGIRLNYSYLNSNLLNTTPSTTPL